jgi:predicted nucleic acid-binding protein
MMILVDTGPLVALFDPKDQDHLACRKILEDIVEPLYTTEAVLTEVLHLLIPGSKGAEGVKAFFVREFISLVSLNKQDITRAFTLMDKYQDLPMDFADATLIVVGENLKTDKVFTLDFNDFGVYKIQKGHKYYSLNLIGPRASE